VTNKSFKKNWKKIEKIIKAGKLNKVIKKVFSEKRKK